MFKIFENYPNLTATVSERKDGSMKISQDSREHSHILENVRMFLSTINIETSDLARASLCHGKNVEQVFEKNKGKIFENTDGLITKEKDIFLSVTVADCLPIYLFDPKKETIALIHAGWRGLEKEIIKKVVEKMSSELGCSADEILVGIGPSIGPCHFEIREDVSKFFLKFGDEVKRENRGKIFLDLKRIAQLQLIENGILRGNIEVNKDCTYCEKDKYFSFRRDAKGDLEKLEAMIAVFGMKA